MTGPESTGAQMTDPETTGARRVDVLVVGAGPAGLATAARLAAAGAGRVEIVDRETRAGGAPRHCAHGGYGTLLHPLTGPAYARLLVTATREAGATVRTGVTALDWAGPLALHTLGAEGPGTITARAVVLATGARERPRAARLVPGTRPAGVYTTGELQQAVHLYGQRIGTRAVVVGAEDVSYAAADTVRAAGATVVAMLTDLPGPQTTPARAADSRLRHGTPLLTGTAVVELLGQGRLSGVRVRHRHGRTAVLPCDTVVFTGDFVPEHELARRGGLILDPGTRGPAVDGALRTSRPGVFAVGSVLHAVESAATAVREGTHAAGAVLDHLAATGRPSGAERAERAERADRADAVPLLVDPPLRWVAPNRVTPADRLPYVLRTATRLTRPVLHVTQNGRVLHRERLWTAALPNRTLRLPAGWTHRVDPGDGPVHVSVRA
ncbi:NAD(P)/FAD-dependent oxidoreductase [Streptomyces sp. SLBN-115]|uniref:NAD(P)/FAD-dependent oxidoreductase n=1 Tax=Streptomyces sp. SLBN-115 TaxID=2768453 RepID=UPI00116CD0B5|nr:FAD-dependent oxidoreductase [Streptomyces sp. SLBN-115]TQJ57126.1 thioredoxin reductase [Streptomyces sp. SLBN-115]